MYEFYIFTHNLHVWENFVASTAAGGQDGDTYISTLNDALERYKGVIKPHYVEFATEEDFIVFRLSFA